ncbi:hypothetical protein F5888DRAFT_1274100 [Russula emetica]|nr:hypothetical protein F5888DRAFT_1274100 [Russula emetica]
MAFSSRKETYDSNTPSDLSSRTSMNGPGALYRRSSKGTTIQPNRESISNSSVHTTSTAATRKDLFDCSEQGPGGVPSISHRKSLHSLDKPTFRFKNQSQSTVGTVRNAGSIRTSTANSTSKQKIRPLNVPSFEDEDSDESPLPSTTRSSIYTLSTLPEPSPRSSRIYGVIPSTPLDDPLTKPYGDSQPFSTTEIPTADKTPARHPSSLPPPTDRMGTTSLSHTVHSSKEATSSVPGTVTNHKVYDGSSPSAPSSFPTPKISVEYHKPSRQIIEKYQEFLRNVDVHAAAAKDPFVPPRQAHPPPSSHNASKPSRSQQKAPAPPHPSQINRVNPADFYADHNPTAVLGTAPTAPLDGLPEVSLSPTPADNMGITLRSRGGSDTPKSKKGMLSIMTDYLNSHKRPEISPTDFLNSNKGPETSTPYDPVHLTHVGFNSSTGEFTGLPKKWQQTIALNGTVEERPTLQPPTAPQQRSPAVASLAGATPRRREKKKEDNANDADIVRRLQQICTDADPTQLYRNLIKIRQG